MQRRGEPAEAALPVDEGAGLLRRGRDRKHHVGAFGDLAVSQFQADHEVRGVQRGQHGVRIGEVGGFDAADQQRAQASVGCTGQYAVGVTSGRRRQFSDVPCGTDLRAGGVVGQWAAAGQQRRQRAGIQRAALAGPPWHPGQPGAGGVGEARGADNPPGTVARRSPTMMTALGVESSSRISPVARPSSVDGSAPGAVLSKRPDIFQRASRERATAYTGTLCLRAALRSRRNTMGDSSSGSNPTSRTTGADSRSL